MHCACGHLRSRGGFTLVEVVVVAVIVAVLAAAALPIYLDYINDSRTSTASNVGGSVAHFCGCCINSAGTVSLAGNVLTCSANSTELDIAPDIAVTVTGGASGGIVTAQHLDGGSTLTFHY